ncbi:MAG TPA: C25 family cysteine peptidase [Bacteroidales bacterium]|mgnify:CR=1 FL=1|nr:C25 family cysteine peptidase [Bacteroidales bacterium]
MKKILLFLFLLNIALFSGAQQETSANMPVRKVTDKGTQGVSINYSFKEISTYQLSVQHTAFVRLNVKDFTFLKEVGKPALPAHYDIVLIPDGAAADIVLKNADYSQQDNLLIYPALRPATDRFGDPEPAFEIDSAFYQSNTWYPENPVKIVHIIKVKGISLAVVQVCPVQYNPQLRQAKLFSKLDYEIVFSQSASLIAHKEQYSSSFLKNLQNIVLNSYSLNAEVTAYSHSLKSSSVPKTAGPKNYIIVTHSDYLAAADSLAKWKSQMGNSVEIISRSSWTSTQIKSDIQSRYQAWTPKPDYFVIIGDHNKVPGEIHQDPTYGDNFATDLYYACMDGTNDYVADMAFGRISVSSAVEAMTVVNKIIKYEKDPPTQQNFYHKGTVCGFFQDDEPDTYEDRRFLRTSEEIRNYMMTQGFTVDRIYKADAAANPLYYNNGYYANSEPLPSVLLRSNGFPWAGNKDTIAAAINSTDGRLFVTHRDHGYVGGTGWASPEFTSTHIGLLNNGDKLPVVFSINCHTGEYQLTECFAEKFLRRANGGAVGVFAAAYYSWSGNNDGLIDGLIDAIWANPGLIPNFTGNGDSPTGSPVAHQPIYTMGDVLNQGLIRMVQTWGDDVYTHELFHYFGDPAMKIWTAVPGTITAVHDASLDCHDTTFTINSCSGAHCLVTLVVDGELIASDSLNATPLTLHFFPVLGSSAVLTISRLNYRPYVANIPFNTACLRPNFTITYNSACVGQEINITNTSTGTIQTYNWNFGSGATPQTANTSGPFQITYASPGMKIITLTVANGTSSETFTDSVYIEQPCVYYSVQNQYTNINACQGILYDNGGLQDYLPNSNDTITISVPGASSINLHFADFDVEQGDNGTCNYDNLQVFNGNATTSPLIGKYCSLAGNTPPANIVSTGNAITLLMYSDGYVNGRGYVIEFNCSASGQAPSPAFTATPLTTCDGEIQFTDLSTNAPTTYHWDFGDGTTSNLQNPMHTYQANGTYTVMLTAMNAYGQNTFTRIDYVTVLRPEAPIAIHDTLCGPAQAVLSVVAGGTVEWYDDEIGGNLVYTGSTFATAVLDTIRTYYAASVINETFTAGPADYSFGSGGYYAGTSQHYLIFNCLENLRLISVDVYADTVGNRTIKLLSAAGTLILDTVINLPVGKTTVYLNWDIAAGTQYRLALAGPVLRLYRNTNGAAYSYTVNGLVSITGNSYSTSTYYYFYNWHVQGNECTSARTPVSAYVYTQSPEASFTAINNSNSISFTNTSQNAYAYYWDFDDGNFSAEENPLHTYSNVGSYLVSLTAYNACGNDVYSDTVDVNVLGTGEIKNTQNFSVYPNPADGSIVIRWNGGYENISFIEISDICGQQLVIKEIAASKGANAERIDLNGFAQGVYFVKLITGKQKTIEKLVVF